MTRDQAFPGDQIVSLVSLVMTGVALLSLGVFPTRPVEFPVLGSPLGLVFSIRWLVVLLLILLTSAGMDALVRSISGHERLDLFYSFTFWVLPGLVTLAASTSVPGQFGRGGDWVGAMLLLGALLALVVVAECGTIDLDGPYYRAARLSLNIATYGAALALYSSIYGLQARSLISSTAIILITFPLALELLRGTEEQLRTTWLHAAVIALVTGQFSWPLNALGLGALHGGALVLLMFYTLSGITQQHLAGRLNRRVALEFCFMAALFAGLILLSARRASRQAALENTSGDIPSESLYPAPLFEPGEDQAGSDLGIDTFGEQGLPWPGDAPEGLMPLPLEAPPVEAPPARPRDLLDKP